MEDAVSLEITLPINRVIIADIHGEQYRMLRLYGLFACVFLAFVFPILAYEYNQTAMVYNAVSTVFSCVVVIAIFSSRNDQVG
jgi:hypothetical protein